MNFGIIKIKMSQQDCDLREGIKSNDLQAVKSSLKNGASLIHPLPGYKYNALFLAIDQRHQEIVDYLTEEGAYVDYEDELYNCQTPLAFAIYKNALAIVKLLVSKGADVNRVHLDGDTPLTRAVRLNKLRIVEFLLQQGAEIDLMGWKEKSPLMWAITKNNLAAVQLLVSHGADVGQAAIELAKKAKNTDIANLLSSYRAAIIQGDSKMMVVKAMLQDLPAGSSETSINKVDAGGNTPLLKAIECGKVEAVLYLLTLGADACKSSSDGVTPLLLAVQKKDVDIVRLLLENGAEHTIYTAFLEAIAIGDSEMVNLLLESGAFVNVVYKNGRTPLTKAIEEENFEVIRILVANGANINMPDGKDQLPLTVAVQKNNLSIVKYLLDNSSPPQSLLNCCPFLLKYIDEGNFEMVDLLIDMGVKLDVVFECGETPLTKAVQNDNFKIIKYLVDKGANVDMSGADGKVPLAISASNGNIRTVKFLISAKAKIDLAQEEIDNYAKSSEDFAIYLDIVKGKYKEWDNDVSM